MFTELVGDEKVLLYYFPFFFLLEKKAGIKRIGREKLM